jgi:hypothetical protein
MFFLIQLFSQIVERLQNVSSDWQNKVLLKEENIRAELKARRLILFDERRLSEKVVNILKSIFSMYERYNANDNGMEETGLGLEYTAAARLWYRCGLRLANLDSLMGPRYTNRKVVFQDFFELVEKVVAEDYVVAPSVFSFKERSDAFCQIGDKVQLVEDFEKYLDEPGGPLRPGERGIVVQVQEGLNGCRRSIRVLHNGRRWWYPPKAIVSERSGLVESPAVWFLRRIFRSHGYDLLTLESLSGKPIDPSFCEVGDFVIPKKSVKNEKFLPSSAPEKPFARIAGDTPLGLSTWTSLRADPGSVTVEFVERRFGESVGTNPTDPSGATCVRKIRSSKLMYGDWSIAESKFQDTSVLTYEVDSCCGEQDSCFTNNATISGKAHAEIAGLARLEKPAIEAVLRECKRSSETLSSLFSNGLPDALLKAIDSAERQMNSLEPREDLAERISAVGCLVMYLANQFFKEPHIDTANSLGKLSGDSRKSDSFRSHSSHITPDQFGQIHLNAPIQQEDSHDGPRLSVSLQQRRNVLLSLMSRARGSNPSYLSEMLEQGNQSMARELAMGQIPPPFGSVRDLQPFGFGPARHVEDGAWDLAANLTRGNEHDRLENSNCSGGEDNSGVAEASRPCKASCSPMFLDSVLRCRGETSAGNPISEKGSGASQCLFASHLISKGLLTGDLAWVKAETEAEAKKSHSASLQRTSTISRYLVDEEGTPILRLAIVLGCSPPLLGHLVSCGAFVGVEEMRRAAETGQSQVLAYLMRYHPFPEGFVDLDICSPEVRRVLCDAKRRQEEMNEKMRTDGGDFITNLLGRLVMVCLSARRHQNVRLITCSRSIADLLAGNVLLRALQHAQTRESSLRDSEHNDAEDLSGRFSVEDTFSEMASAPNGLLGSVPLAVLHRWLMGDSGWLTVFLQLIEDFLCCKDTADIAAGLSFLCTLLERLPGLRSSQELRLYGMHEFVVFHDTLASKRLDSILARQQTQSLKCIEHEEIIESTPNISRDNSNFVVLCPKRHCAVLHITRHASFRCDLCGNGVERGRPMHGCRECDWDACGECMDKAESGLVKCQTIRDLASTCHRLLGATESTVEKHEVRVTDIDNLAERLVKRDVTALKDLAKILNAPGGVSFHQFLVHILPALHVACLGCSDDAAFVRSSLDRRTKRARFIGCPSTLSTKYTPLLQKAPNRTFCECFAQTFFGSVAHVGNDGDRDLDEGTAMVTDVVEASELVRRLHQTITFHESIPIVPGFVEKPGQSGFGSQLQRLKKPIEIALLPSHFEGTDLERDCEIGVFAEPLVSMADLELHVLRTYPCRHPRYSSFSSRLALDKAIIVERPVCEANTDWKIAQIVGYDERIGAHCVRYASKPKQGPLGCSLRLHQANLSDLLEFEYDGDEIKLVLAAREYFILHRPCVLATRVLSPEICEGTIVDETEISSDHTKDLKRSIGKRVESNCISGEQWKIFTLVSSDNKDKNPHESYTLVSDEGAVYCGVRAHRIRVAKTDVGNAYSHGRVGNAIDGREALNQAFPFLSTRQRTDFGNENDSQSFGPVVGTLKRNWSALSLVDSMRPIELNSSLQTTNTFETTPSELVIWKCIIGITEYQIASSRRVIELPTRLKVTFSPHTKLPGIDLGENDTTIIAAFQKIHERHPAMQEWPLEQECKLFFSIQEIEASPSSFLDKELLTSKHFASHGATVSAIDSLVDETWIGESTKRHRNASSGSIESFSDPPGLGLCAGLGDACVQTMDLISVLASFIGIRTGPLEEDDPDLSSLANTTLSKKLSDQLDDPISVVGGALPDWCTLAPFYAPRVFSYKSRRMLLERVAFGISRGTLKQQEAKVNIGRLRQRMAALRGRAVELVGEAFSGGAEDPTALQLQADELYGMEEALAARVRAAFRSAKWQEHSLQVAKAAVRRDFLLADATVVMEKYANDEAICRRRLEVRFEGESGFDAAAGDEAGVTRGFYADVAEALLSSDAVAGVFCATNCSVPVNALLKTQTWDIAAIERESLKLPLWIPDMDSGGQIVIPTPRSDKRSGLGVYPRPLPKYHPQMREVLSRFRFIGRLFAAAIRDGFMFPLPLSSAFLKLVQYGNDTTISEKDNSFVCTLLTSSELPRPGFLGGEVYAAEAHICERLDRVDRMDPPLSRLDLEKQYDEIGRDPNFAREALGKSYECSFEDYFQDRTFVDPLDPTQGEDAVPLCPNGSQKSVTIRNVREWVDLAKMFVLYEGVIAQAMAFRDGVNDFFNPDYLRVFTADELQRDVCGVGDNVDNWNDATVRKLFKLDGGKGAAEAMVAVAAIGGEGGAAMSRRFGPSSPTIQFLVQALLEAKPKQRRQFLSFVTSIPIATPGRIEVVPIISPNGEFLPMQDPSCLPRANTCARRLYLPKFETYDTFAQILWAVVREESHFKGFYEWRG